MQLANQEQQSFADDLFIQDILKVILRTCEPDYVLLFGSYAKGTWTPSSDIDILIVGDSNQPRHARSLHLEASLAEYAVHTDILYYTSEEMDAARRAKYSFINTILKSGIVLYQRSDGMALVQCNRSSSNLP
ncbi:nucleotidyltransferase domain-containing protein [Chloroflexi bacterium TSY]|nr:nucleotidyltransferase domain-containing protein [Chloroflexi bacterium TSY]